MLFVWEDPASWRPLLDAMPRRTRATAFVEEVLRTEYEGIVVYHACRPESTESYYRDGLKLLDRQHAYDRARSIFLSGDFPELTEDLFREACSRISDVDDQRAFVGVDQRDLLEGGGHYLIYGSEVICGIAAGLSGHRAHRDYRQVLKRFGQPTVFRLSLPFAKASVASVTALAQEVRAELPWIRREATPGLLDFTFRLQVPLPGAHFLGHSHPEQVLDPLLGMTTYTVP